MTTFCVPLGASEIIEAYEDCRHCRWGGRLCGENKPSWYECRHKERPGFSILERDIEKGEFYCEYWELISYWKKVDGVQKELELFDSRED